MPRSTAHLITGKRDEVRAALARAHELGRLVSIEGGQLLPGGQVRVLAYLLGTERNRWERCRPWLVVAGKALVVMTLLAGIGGVAWLIVLGVLELIALVTSVVAWVQAHWGASLAGGVLLAFLALAGLSGGGCGGLHCRRCRG